MGWLVPVFLVVATIVLVRRELISVRRWAWPVLVISWVLSMSTCNIVLWGSEILKHLQTPWQPASWIVETWRYCGWILALCWIPALVVVLRFGGVSFALPKVRRRALQVAKAILIIACLVDSFVFVGVNFFLQRRVAVAAATSPDGRCRVHVYVDTGWLEPSYEVMSESGGWCPVLARSLYRPVFFGSPPAPNDPETQLVWSADSQVLALWFGRELITAYDFGKGYEVTGSPNADNIDHVMAAHGGAAP
jgi:hypothetical protein